LIKVLFVDDEELILRSLKRELRHESYEQYFVNNGSDALEILEKEDINVLVTDMRMPTMNGLELLEIVKVVYPNLVKIVLSGYTQLPQVLVTINKGDIFRFITKPWKLDEDLKVAINDGINYSLKKVKNSNDIIQFENKNKTYEKIFKRFDIKKEFIISDVMIIQKAHSVIMKEIGQLLNSIQEPIKKDAIFEKNKIERLLEMENKILLNFPFAREYYSYSNCSETIKNYFELNHSKVEILINYPDLESARLVVNCFFPLMIFSEVLNFLYPQDKALKVYLEIGESNLNIGNKYLGVGLLMRVKLSQIEYSGIDNEIKIFNEIFTNIFKIKYAHNKKELALEIIPICEAKEI
jgi:CheY-like chemotaxis protein